MCPLVNQVLGNDLRTKNIFFLQLGDTFKILNPQTQVIELPARKIEQAQGKARGKNLSLHDLVAQQLEFARIK